MVGVIEPVPSQDGRGPGNPLSAPSEDLAELSDAAWTCLDQLARALRVDEADREATLHAIVTSATATVSAADAAGLNLLDGNRFVPQAVHGTAPPILDRLQQRSGTGPCIDASRDQQTIEAAEMRAEKRWPQFAARAVELGVLSMLCVPLWIDDRTLGSLSLYAGSPAAFDAPAHRLAELFATHAALALGDAQRTARLRRAMLNRDVIGQAKGMLMERHQYNAEQAYDLLVRASRQTNRKVIDLAEELVTTGRVLIP